MYEIYSKGATPYEGIDNRDQKQHLQEGNRLERPDNMPQHMYVLSYARGVAPLRKYYTHARTDRVLFLQLLILQRERV